MLTGATQEHTILDFCHLISPSRNQKNVANQIDFLNDNIDAINHLLLDKGAVVLRDFAPLAVEELEQAIKIIGGKEVFYKGGLGPRTKVGKGVYTASDINKIFPIKLHQEMSYQDNFPDNVVFYCNSPATIRGETTLANIRKITQDMPVATRDKFLDLGVRYVSVFHDKHHRFREQLKKIIPFYLHLTWQDAFGSDDRDLVEAECQKRNLDVKWRKNGDLETTAILPAFRKHPATDERLWFNSIVSLHFNRRTLHSDFGNLIYYLRLVLYPNRKNLPNQVYFGDGSPIDYSELLPIYHAYDRNTYFHPWQKGDLMLLDNRIVAHGRNSYRGPRSVFASLINERFTQTESFNAVKTELANEKNYSLVS